MISIIIPTLNRPYQLINSLDKLEETTEGIPIEIVVIADEGDIKTITACKDYFQERAARRDNQNNYILQVVKGSPTSVEKWNSGAMRSSGEWLVLGADDLDWSFGWLRKSLDTPNKGFLALQDFDLSEKNFEPHYMATRAWLKEFNGGVLTIPWYKYWGPDLEIAKRAQRAGHYVVSAAVVPHKHYLWNLTSNDSTYKKAKPYLKTDLDKFNERELKGFPNDFDPIIT